MSILHTDQEGELLVHEEAYLEARSLIESAQEIVVASHTNADGDALGSLLATYLVLRTRYPQKHIVALGSDTHPVPRYLAFLPHAEDILAPEAYKEAPDLFIALDVPNTERLHKSERILKKAEHILVIDHHEPENVLATASLIAPDAAATALILLSFFRFCDYSISKEVAHCLYTALMCDTGRFQFQNTRAGVFVAGAFLVENGAQPALAAQAIYQEIPYNELKLKSMVLSNLELTASKRIAYSTLTLKEIEEVGATKEDISSFVDEVRMCEGVEVAVFFRELSHGAGIRVNLRAKGSCDVSKVARNFGGGGHKAAAGCTLITTLSNAVSQVIECIELVMDM